MKKLLCVLMFLACDAVAQDFTATVAQAKAQAVSLGFAGTGLACQTTARAAFLLQGEGFGLVAKSDVQNGCTFPQGRFAVDALMLRDGRTWDILVNAETENIPAWNPTGASDPSLWLAPFDLGTVTPTPIPVPIPQPVPDLSRLEARIEQLASAEYQRDLLLGDAVRGVRVSLEEHRASLKAILQQFFFSWDTLKVILGGLAAFGLTETAK